MAEARKRAVRRKPKTADKVAEPQTDTAELARICARVASDRKAEEIVVLDLSRLTYVTDYFVIASAGNSRQMTAISGAVQEEMSRHGVRCLGAEGVGETRWTLLDFGDIIVHIFDPEWRKLYDLDLLWGDVPRLDWTPPPAKPRRATARK